MLQNSISCGDTVMFSKDAIVRFKYDKNAGDARGVVLTVTGRVAKVDFKNTWTPNDNSDSIRHVPIANLIKCN